jgi:hypothetical protein
MGSLLQGASREAENREDRGESEEREMKATETETNGALPGSLASQVL